MNAQLLQSRRQRMLKLLLYDAPDQIVFNEARLILLAESDDKLWMALWNWFTKDLRESWRVLKGSLRIWWLMRQGWQEMCAIGIATGDKPTNHSKYKCNCEEKFQQELEAAIRRESE